MIMDNNYQKVAMPTTLFMRADRIGNEIKDLSDELFSILEEVHSFDTEKEQQWAAEDRIPSLQIEGKRTMIIIQRKRDLKIEGESK